ncbi:acyl-CoA dehydrogenase family protein [Amycolatopsis sp. NPDC051128]|uniref:acyl-CoA dehydrogenase family protein n=1 Tax=Amycolatopsis sp. NPDC051128 TaxID=3155412 RepID=UPI003435B11C
MTETALVGILSDEQLQLRQVLRTFLDRHSAEPDVRRLMATDEGYDARVWRRLGGELGLPGLAIPEEYGGSGFGYAELGLVFEETGRALLCAPYFGTVALAAEVLLRAGDEAAAKDLLPGIAAGETVAALALTEPGGRWDEAGITVRAERVAGRWLLSGVKTYVLDGHIAHLLLVVARTDTGIGLFAVDPAGEPGLRRTPLRTVDQTRKQARLDFSGVPARLIGDAGTAWPAIARALSTAAVLLAAEQLGGASRALELAVDYAKIREQYGRAIGSFQAVKHRLADMLTDVECARSAVQDGLRALAADAEDLPVAASVAKACCSEVFTRVTAGAIQVHGGIGFTWEHSVQLYFKRAKASELLLGSPAEHRARLAERLGL